MLRPGTRIGGLRIDDLLGRGAMGEVYRAEQLTLKRPVAVKRIADHLLMQPESIARFHREAQTLARVHSPHVVGVHDFGRMRAEDGSEHWLLVMELVEGGRSLRAAVGKPMEWRPATALALMVAQGLAAAAELGVVHRDVKPDNVIVSTRGIAKLADFGLARSIDSTDMTVHGSVVGTPAYMPPEACRGEAVDARGDLYALGATWYQLLTGRTPFQAENTPAMLRRHIDDQPTPVAELVPAVPARIAELVHRCLAKERDRRPASAAALVADLRALAADGIVLPDSVPLPEQTAPQPDPGTAATVRATPPSSFPPGAQSETATVAPTASTAPTVLSPPTQRRRRTRRFVLVLGAVSAVGVLAAGVAVLARDAFAGERARVERTLAAGDFEMALRQADALAARWPDRREAIDIERAVISAEIDRALGSQSYAHAREILAERRRGREWLDGEPLAMRIDLAEGRTTAEKDWDGAAKIFADLRHRHPKDLAICQALVEALGKESVDESVVDAALALADAGQPSPQALDALSRAYHRWGPTSDESGRVRAALIRHRPTIVGEARADLDQGTKDDPDPRIAAYLLLSEAGKLAPEEELRYHVRNLSELSDSYQVQRDALEWLTKAVAQPGWAQRKAAAKLAPIAQVEGLNHEDEREPAIEDLLVAGFVPEIADALPKWMALTDDDFEDLRFHAWRLLHRAGLAAGFDDFAFHAATLRTFRPSYDRPVLDEALAFFKAQAGTPRAGEARAAVQAGMKHVEDVAALYDKNMPGTGRGPHVRKQLPKLQAVLDALK